MNSPIISKRYLTTIIVISLLVAFSSFTVTQEEKSNLDIIHFQNPDTKVSMLSVLEALESGNQYEKPESWNRKNYFEFDIPVIITHNSDFHFDFDEEFEYEFDFEFPEFRIDEDFFRNLEERMEVLEERMQERLKRLEKRMESLHRKI